MALSANTAWEIRPTNGNDTNGGGFVAGATGTDYSQQNAKNTVGNNISTTDAAANGTTTITSATASFTSAIVGNIIFLSGGTGAITAQWRQVTAFTNSTTITIDATIAASTGMTMNIGGALQTLSKASAIYVASNKIFFKAEATQQISAGITFATGVNASNTAPPSRIIGYTTTRADAGRGTIQLITNSGLTAITLSGIANYLENFVIDCNSLATSTGITASGSESAVINCKVMNFKTRGISCAQTGAKAISCEVTGGVAGATNAITLNSGATEAAWCWIHDNACPGIQMNADGDAVISCLITNNSGASSDGVQLNSIGGSVIHCTIYGNGSDGIHATSTGGFGNVNIRGNILANNAGYGLNSSAGWAARPAFDGNAYFSNTSGTRNNVDDTITNAIDGVASYTNVFDVVLVGSSPFTNAAGGDWTLNNSAGAGALLRGTFANSFIPGAGLRSYEDFGAYQHQDSGGGMVVHPGMHGRIAA